MTELPSEYTSVMILNPGSGSAESSDLLWSVLFPDTWDPTKSWEVYSRLKSTSIMNHNVPNVKNI